MPDSLYQNSPQIDGSFRRNMARIEPYFNHLQGAFALPGGEGATGGARREINRTVGGISTNALTQNSKGAYPP